LNCFIRFVNI